MSDIEKLPLTSKDVNEDRIEALRELFPEAFREGKIDWLTLQRSLGEWSDPGKERFGLNWPGKADCMRTIQQPSVGTLLPMREESVNFDTTENLIIEGDNLEVLKLLQKSYYGKVKMIYIDPPYNTGNEFIYPDNFQEGLQDYLRYSGQVDAEGLKLSTNTETDGRYHSKWLNMLYPRLFLARNLLRDDGVVYVSIDDNEAHNLRLLMNEIFGEENFIATIAWEKIYTTKNDDAFLSSSHEYLLCYARNINTVDFALLPRSDEMDARYRNVDNDPRGPWKAIPLYAEGERKNGRYKIVAPNGAVFEPRQNMHWRYREEDVLDLIRDNRIYFGLDGNSQPNSKRFLSEVRQGVKAKTLWFHDEVGSNDTAKREAKEIFGENIPFSYPKPSSYIQRMIQLCSPVIPGTRNKDIILDFFAGSGTTGQAVIAQNKADGGSRSFVLVQLPEATGDVTFKNICEITRERIRRFGAKALVEFEASLDLAGTDSIDVGFKSYRLGASNFKVWNGEVDELADIGKSLRLFAEHVDEDRQAEEILYELLLKAGFLLTASVERAALADKEVFFVSEGALLICLDRDLTLEVIEAMVEKTPQMIICLDEGFKGNDQLKVNAVQTVKSRNQNEETDIVFRVV